MSDTLNAAAIVSRCSQLVRERYVFASVADEISDTLDRQLAAGTYTDASAPDQLAALVTTDLQSVNGDKHARLTYHRDEIPDSADPTDAMADYARQALDAMGGILRVERLAGNIAVLEPAHLLYPVNLVGNAIAAAMNLVAPAAGLIIDLRRLRGGDPDTVSFLWGYLLDGRTHLNSMVTRDGEAAQTWSPPWVSGTRYGAQKPLWVLTSSTTFSGGEEIAYAVQQLGRGKVVGETTGGGAHARDGVTVHPHLELTIPVMAARNPVSGGNWEGTGVQPDIPVPAVDALSTAHQLALNELTKATSLSGALRREIASATPVPH